MDAHVVMTRAETSMEPTYENWPLSRADEAAGIRCPTDPQQRRQPEMVVEAEAGEEAETAYCGGPGRLTPAQFAYLFKDVQDSATFDRARKRVKTWPEFEAFLVQWNAEHQEEDEDAQRKKRWRAVNNRRRRRGRGRRYGASNQFDKPAPSNFGAGHGAGV